MNLLEAKLIRTDGQAIDVEILAAPIVFEGSTALQLIARDVTERKRAEEVQREADRLRIALDKERELGDLKTRLMVTISHEFRTPLSIIYTSTELLEKFLDRMKPEQRAGHLHKIQQQISKLTELMDDISVIIHSSFDRVVPNFKSTDVRQLCETVLAESPAFAESRSRVQFDADPDLPRLRLDQRRIRYVLTNLLSNALKYSPPGSTVELRAHVENQSVVLTVLDHGIGIPPEEQSRVFEPFYRAQNVGNTGGTGLGLSIVKGVIDLHGAAIDLISEVGAGTQIAIIFPIDTTHVD